MCEVEVQTPLHVLGTHEHAFQVNLDTMVHHATHVDGELYVGTKTRRQGEVLIEQHVGGLLHEVLNTTVQTSLEEVEVETNVYGMYLLPSELIVTLLGQSGTVLACGGIVRGRIHIGIYIVAAKALVTLQTIAGLELQEVNPLLVLQELFLVHSPSKACATEVTPAMTGSET